MTPKEKAQELVDKFYQTTPNEAWYFPPVGSITSSNYSAWEQAKKCALIAVDEILNNNCGSHTGESNATNNEIYCDAYYWEQVKSKIESL